VNSGSRRTSLKSALKKFKISLIQGRNYTLIRLSSHFRIPADFSNISSFFFSLSSIQIFQIFMSQNSKIPWKFFVALRRKSRHIAEILKRLSFIDHFGEGSAIQKLFHFWIETFWSKRGGLIYQLIQKALHNILCFFWCLLSEV